MPRQNYKYIAITAFVVLQPFILFRAAQAQMIPRIISAAPEGVINKIAPGEFLPISVKLVNFGSFRRADVSITYKIFNSADTEVYSESETVAVDTTASFIKRIPLPPNLNPGLYTAVSTLRYVDQQQPAVSKFQFTVEKKIGGFFVSDLIFYSVVMALMIAIVTGILLYLVTRQRMGQRMVLHDYAGIPKAQRIYYEIVSDIIAQMRLRIGDDALEIAQHIPALEINDENGRVLHIAEDPAKIVALLIRRYQTFLGQPISFGLRTSSQ